MRFLKLKEKLELNYFGIQSLQQAKSPGINTLRAWTQRVATWLALPNPNTYTGLCF